VTYDFDSVDDQQVTVRERDTMKQERIAMDAVTDYLTEKLECSA
jgi:glycyl-tRNA synthetase